MFISYKICNAADTAEIIEAIVYRAKISVNKECEFEVKVTETPYSLAVYLNRLVCLPCLDCLCHLSVMSFTFLIYISLAE